MINDDEHPQVRLELYRLLHETEKEVRNGDPGIRVAAMREWLSNGGATRVRQEMRR